MEADNISRRTFLKLAVISTIAAGSSVGFTVGAAGYFEMNKNSTLKMIAETSKQIDQKRPDCEKVEECNAHDAEIHSQLKPLQSKIETLNHLEAATIGSGIGTGIGIAAGATIYHYLKVR